MEEDFGQISATADQGRALTRALFEAAVRLGISCTELGSVIGMSAVTITRMERHGSGLRVGTKPWDTSVQVVQMYCSLVALVGDQDGAARSWFDAPVTSFGGQSPRQMIQRDGGLVEVLDYLDTYLTRS
ncbi:antitoxin Xre/MbcA/ParS toxin-binding domain-containing protein [Niveibacterium microcysteis]|uniref:DUF2384 domain-containing protein n=1 Tax=Niveibacterium microcysteis TaxID=2811415 RepID=A0ABX7M0R5_9RHOO|nr:antitoxin Xre/MbcA/ParS toxin-binding domain-containing protein [Niveibacterium microcysteis]QSI75354.1 DUF2384 domain-containing protein [Niveibacterium microcysteis]